MKKKNLNTWKEFCKTGKIFKINKPVEEKTPKKIHWELIIHFDDGHLSTFTTINPDSDDFEGEYAYNNVLEWFQCSDNPSFVMWFTGGLRIFVRDKISEIEVTKKEI